MEEIRKTLETCDLEEVMAAFIAENATGDSRQVLLSVCVSGKNKKLLM